MQDLDESKVSIWKVRYFCANSPQEAKQLLYAHEACKWYNRVPSYQYVPRLIEQAVRYSMAGRPGACYIDLPADVMREAIPSGRGSIEQPPMGLNFSFTAKTKNRLFFIK